MTDQHEALTLGRRLDALARTRVRKLAPRLAWAAPLAVTLRHSEEVADVIGQRFERTETPPPARAEPPLRPADLMAAGRAVPGTWAGPGRPGQGVRHRPAPNGSSTVGQQAEPRPAGDEWEGEADDVRPVPADVRSRLRREVGRAADLMRVHAGPEADAQARAADADAVTKGSDVYLRQGRWAPRREEGVALLAHEATHVAAFVDPGTASRKAVGDTAEEARARARERSLLGSPFGPSSTRPAGGTGLPAVLDGLAAPFITAPEQGSPVSPAAPAHFAHTAHEAPAPPSPNGAAPAASGMRAGVERELAPSAPAPDLDALRRGVIAEVMQRLRSEIERGA